MPGFPADARTIGDGDRFADAIDRLRAIPQRALLRNHHFVPVDGPVCKGRHVVLALRSGRAPDRAFAPPIRDHIEDRYWTTCSRPVSSRRAGDLRPQLSCTIPTSLSSEKSPRRQHGPRRDRLVRGRARLTPPSQFPPRWRTLDNPPSADPRMPPMPARQRPAAPQPLLTTAADARLIPDHQREAVRDPNPASIISAFSRGALVTAA